MKKKKLIPYFIIIMFFMSLNNVKAIYNGEGGVVFSGSGNFGCSNNNPYCTYKSSSDIIIKASVFYVENGKFDSQIGESYYFVNKEMNKKLENSGLKLKYLQTLDSCTGNDRYSCASAKLKKYFGDEKDPTTEGKNFLNTVVEGNYLNVLTKESEYANKTTAATKGYRIILEPTRIFVNIIEKKTLSVGKKALLTPKEIAGVAVNYGKDEGDGHYSFNNMYIPSCTFAGGCTTPLLGSGSFAQVFYTTFKDVGISSESISKCEKVNIKTLADETNGCGYNIIDISQYVEPPKCYNKNIIETNGSLKCTNIDQNNTATYTEKYVEMPCKNEENENDTNSKYGKLIMKSDNCNVYCIESSFASFPGNISGSLPIDTIGTRGTYFAWPSRIGTPGMTMLMKVKLSCTIVQNKGKMCTNNDIEKLTKSVKSTIQEQKMSAYLKAGTNKQIDEKLTSYNIRYNDKYDINDINFNIKLTNGISNEFSISKEAYFKIPENKNRLYNKESDNVFDGILSSSNTVYNRGEGVISLNKKDDTSKIYDLMIYNVKLGSENQFGEKITNYVCKYKIKIDDCVCPEGTLREGESLYNELVSGKTCSELQVTSCNICRCPPNSSNEYEILKVGEDATTTYCKQLQKEKCYNNNNYCFYNGKKIELTECISTQMTTNKLTTEEAKTYCEQILCPICTDENGNKIDLGSCIKTGNSYTVCKALYCPRNICIDDKCYVCSENCSWKLKTKTNTTLEYKKSCSDSENCGYIKLSCPSGNEKMNNADSCIKRELGVSDVTSALNNGTITENDVKTAFAACESEVCPYSGSKIIYRQIDLENPFPGKNHIGNFTFFNNNKNIKIRIPGDNWNSETAITTKILQARGVNGYELYNKDPLYIIELTPSTIKKIREYNKNNPYDDFNLICTNANKSADCISDFLHKQGTISNLSPSDFIKPSYGNKNSVSACYNMSYDENSFNKCYNTNN